MVNRDVPLTLILDNSKTEIIPVKDGDKDVEWFENFPGASEIDYVIADDYDSNTVQYEATDSQIDTLDFGNTAADDDSIPDTTTVIRVQIPPTETANFVATGPDTADAELVRECQIRDDGNNKETTVVQGPVAVIGSAIEGE